MKYPRIEVKEKKDKVMQESGKYEARMYAESNSFSEFLLKREIAGIKHFFSFNDSFKMFYFYSNGRQFVYNAYDWTVPLQVILIFMSAIFSVISIFLFFEKPSHTLVAIIVSMFAFSFLSIAIMYIRSIAAAKSAKDHLRHIGSNAEFDL